MHHHPTPSSPNQQFRMLLHSHHKLNRKSHLIIKKDLFEDVQRSSRSLTPTSRDSDVMNKLELWVKGGLIGVLNECVNRRGTCMLESVRVLIHTKKICVLQCEYIQQIVYYITITWSILIGTIRIRYDKHPFSFLCNNHRKRFVVHVFRSHGVE